MIKELRDYDTSKLKSMVVQLKAKILENRFKLTQGDLGNTGVFRQLKKTVAQILTILRERNENLTSKDWRDYMGSLNSDKEK